MKRHCFRVGLAWLVLLAALPVRAAIFNYSLNNGLPMHWNVSYYDPTLFPDQDPTTLAIRYHLGAEGWSAANRTNELNSVRAAFGQWQAIAGMKLQFEEGVMVSGVTDVNANDGTNMVVWLPGNRFINGGTTFFPSSYAGITVLTGTTTDETIVEADIALNASQTWFTAFDRTVLTGLFVEEVALHEIGHFLGLDHSPLGGATMFWTGPQGVGAQAGLSPDEISAAKALYGLPATLAALGTISGKVTLGGGAVLGADLTAEDTNGIVIAGTVTDANGNYTLPALLPGNYILRVTALDPGSGGTDTYLVRGLELDPYNSAYDNATTGFLPLTNQAVTVTAGGTATKNFTVASGSPPFRITGARQYLTASGRQDGPFCIQVTPGQSNQWMAVYLPVLPGTNVTMRLTGGGITYGDTVVVSNALRGMYLVQVPVTVATNAVAGVRSIAVTAGGYTAWANGFAEVLPNVYDFNFDCLDDLFQRRYWSPFTRPAAAPYADPDGDGFVNWRECLMGSDPTNPLSVNYRIVSQKLATNGTTVTWESAPGRRYQVYSRSDLQSAVWTAIGNPVTAAAGTGTNACPCPCAAGAAGNPVAVGQTTQFMDARPTDMLRFYQVRDAP